MVSAVYEDEECKGRDLTCDAKGFVEEVNPGVCNFLHITAERRDKISES